MKILDVRKGRSQFCICTLGAHLLVLLVHRIVEGPLMREKESVRINQRDWQPQPPYIRIIDVPERRADVEMREVGVGKVATRENEEQ